MVASKPDVSLPRFQFLAALEAARAAGCAAVRLWLSLATHVGRRKTNSARGVPLESTNRRLVSTFCFLRVYRFPFEELLDFVLFGKTSL